MKFLFFEIFKVYRKIVLWMPKRKSSCSTLETCYQKINTGFEFLTSKLTFIEPKKDFKWIFEITAIFQIVIRIVLTFVLYFYSLWNYEYRFSRKILGWDKRGSQECKKTPSWSKSRKTPQLCKSAQKCAWELTMTWRMKLCWTFKNDGNG